MSKKPTLNEMLGFRQVSGNDITGNLEIPLSSDPNRTQMPNRYETLDQFSPNAAALVGDDNDLFIRSEDEVDEDEALLDETEEAQFVNSQLDPTEECPSTKNPNRFVAQNRRK